MEEIIRYLYPAVTLVSIMGYIPQIYKLVIATRRPQNIALSSWSIWCVSSLVALLYGIYCLHDTVFIAMAFLGFAATVLTTILIVYNNFFRFEKPSLDDGIAVVQDIKIIN
jgi:uncharacterized protein with PQ loop repeat